MRKRHIFIVLLSLLLAINTSAQELTVLECRPTADPMLVSMQRTDANNDICSLVRVLLPVDGVTLEGNIVGDVSFNGSEYRVYLTQGTKFLQISCPGHYPLRIDFRNYGIKSLDSKRIYELKLKSQIVQQQLAVTTTAVATDNSINGHEYVDLGLSVKWATCNVGASSPEDSGNYYAWGEITTKTEYTKANSETLYKNMDDISGNPQYDAARVNWGGTWRLPTKAEFKELSNKCTWKWIKQDGKKGYRVTGPNGNSIFLPAAGRRFESSFKEVGVEGNYWSSTPRDSDAINVYFFLFGSDFQSVFYIYRFAGYSVRPVSE
ncbi:hypothetical protein [Xylanibacter muris]|uniref:hypothetical protein n=1 Tax=Xylanibacter muris TaxID=2736290 RepID=UPI0025A13BB1|nr:hypothetical protein [Xylanibacter muris]